MAHKRVKLGLDALLTKLEAADALHNLHRRLGVVLAVEQPPQAASRDIRDLPHQPPRNTILFVVLVGPGSDGQEIRHLGLGEPGPLPGLADSLVDLALLLHASFVRGTFHACQAPGRMLEPRSARPAPQANSARLT